MLHKQRHLFVILFRIKACFHVISLPLLSGQEGFGNTIGLSLGPTLQTVLLDPLGLGRLIGINLVSTCSGSKAIPDSGAGPIQGVVGLQAANIIGCGVICSLAYRLIDAFLQHRDLKRVILIDFLWFIYATGNRSATYRRREGYLIALGNTIREELLEGFAATRGKHRHASHQQQLGYFISKTIIHHH